MKKAFITLLLIGGSFVVPVNAFADEHAEKMAVAEKYIEISQIEKMMDGMLEQFTKRPELNLTKEDVKVFSDAYDVGSLKKAVQESMAKSFTLEEIVMLNDFYSTPQGQSILQKMPVYMADVMPLIQGNLQKAIVTLQKHKEAQKKASEN